MPTAPSNQVDMEQAKSFLIQLTHLSHFQFVQEAAWFLLVLLPPLGINFWGQQPFELPKVFIVRTLVWLLTCLALVRVLLEGYSLRGIKSHLQANPIFKPVLFLALIIVVTTATAVNWRLSLWGSYERGQGALTQLTYLLLFWLAATQFRSRQAAQRLLAVMAAAGVPLVLFSLAQAMGWTPFNLLSNARAAIFATLGRANFLGAYLAILAPLTLAQLILSRQRQWKWSWALLLVGELLVIGLTLARSAWLATAVSLAAFALLWWGVGLPRKGRRLAWGGIGLLALSGLLTVWVLGQGQTGSPAARLAIWQGAMKLVGERPLLGYGADALGVIFPRVYPPELVYYQGRDFFVDRAHQIFLDGALTTGLLGLVAFCLVLVTFFMLVKQTLNQTRQPEKRVLLAAIFAAVLGNQVNNLTSFDVTATAAATWWLMGVGAALAQPPHGQAGVPPGKRSLWRWTLGGLLVGGVALAVWYGNGRYLLADVAARRANQYIQVGQTEQAAAAAQKAVTRWPHEPAYYLLLSQTYWQQAQANPNHATYWLSKAEAALNSARQLRSGDAAIRLQLAQFYAAAALQFGHDTRQLADATFQEAALLAPNHATLYTSWGRFRLETGAPEDAAPLLRTAVRLDASNGEAYIYLGAAELAVGRVAAGLADYREAVRLLPNSSQAHVGLAEALWQLGRPAEALQSVQEALHVNPQNSRAAALEWEIRNAP